MRLLLEDCTLLDPEARAPAAGRLLLEGDRIGARLAPGEAAPQEARRVSLGGCAVAPGFVDLHFHGRAIFHDADGVRDALRIDSEASLRHGVTAFLTTTVARPAMPLAQRVSALARALSEDDLPGARALGIHLEGPWIQPDAAGAQPASGIRGFERGEGADLFDRGEGLVRMVTLAPEVEGAADLQRMLEGRDIVAALGHSLADSDAVEEAVGRGARHVTHLFNAMGALHHRAPGLAGVALADDRLSCDVICDGVHVDARMLRVAARSKGGRLILITDRVDPPHDDPRFAAADFGSGALRDDGVALRLADGRLAGSRLTLDRALANATRLGAMTQLDAVAACTLRPARLLGLEREHGTLRPGARADLVVLDAAGTVRQTWLAGRPLFEVDP